MSADTFTLKITVRDDRDGEDRRDHPTYEAMRALLDALPEDLGDGFTLHGAEVVEGEVTREGVPA